MYSNVHGCIGSICYMACPDKVSGISMSILSHYFLDSIGEKYYGSLKLELLIEGFFLLFFILFSFYFGNFLDCIIGWILGNLPDLIDKKIFIKRKSKPFFSCHGGSGLFSYNGFKLGYKVLYYLNKVETILFGILSTLLFVRFIL